MLLDDLVMYDETEFKCRQTVEEMKSLQRYSEIESLDREIGVLQFTLKNNQSQILELKDNLSVVELYLVKSNLDQIQDLLSVKNKLESISNEKNKF